MKGKKIQKVKWTQVQNYKLKLKLDYDFWGILLIANPYITLIRTLRQLDILKDSITKGM